jgi:hypothetical protein
MIAGSQITIDGNMSKPEVLKICFATQQAVVSGGNSADDYVALDVDFTQRAPLDFFPKRTVFGAGQGLLVLGTTSGDQVAWTQSSDCSATGGAATSTKTSEYLIHGLSGTTYLHQAAGAGLYTFCHKPAGDGRWTLVAGLKLTIIPKPTFIPGVGIAGSSTPVTFSGIVEGDKVAMQSSACSAANSTVTGAGTLAPQVINNVSRVYTSTAMTSTGTLRLCYATKESGGDTADDYVMLDATITQRPRPDFTPKRTGMGAAQKLNVSGAIAGIKLHGR